MDGYNERPSIKDGAVEMGEVHDVMFFIVKDVEKFCLLCKGIVRSVY